MDGEYVGGDGSESEGRNVKSFVLRRSCLPPATLHRRSLPNGACLPTLRGPPSNQRTYCIFLGCCFLGSMPVCRATVSAEIAKIANSGSGHCHPFPLSSNLEIHTSGCSSNITRRRRRRHYLNQSRSPRFFPTNSHAPGKMKQKRSYRCDRQISPGAGVHRMAQAANTPTRNSRSFRPSLDLSLRTHEREGKASRTILCEFHACMVISRYTRSQSASLAPPPTPACVPPIPMNSRPANMHVDRLGSSMATTKRNSGDVLDFPHRKGNPLAITNRTIRRPHHRRWGNRTTTPRGHGWRNEQSQIFISS